MYEIISNRMHSLCHGRGRPIHYFFLPLSRAFVPRSIFSAALQIMTAMKPSSELAAVESPIIQVGRGREEGSMDGRGKESKGILPLPQAWYPYSVVKEVVEPMKAFHLKALQFGLPTIYMRSDPRVLGRGRGRCKYGISMEVGQPQLRASD